jgi:hypothetical protein
MASTASSSRVTALAGKPCAHMSLTSRTRATFLDIDAFLTDSAARDFFGVQAGNAPIENVHVPLLAFFGTRGDVGGQADLDTIVAAVRRHHGAAVTTALIDGGDHMDTGREQLVAQVIARRAASLPSSH